MTQRSSILYKWIIKCERSVIQIKYTVQRDDEMWEKCRQILGKFTVKLLLIMINMKKTQKSKHNTHTWNTRLTWCSLHTSMVMQGLLPYVWVPKISILREFGIFPVKQKSQTQASINNTSIRQSLWRITVAISYFCRTCIHRSIIFARYSHKSKFHKETFHACTVQFLKISEIH